MPIKKIIATPDQNPSRREFLKKAGIATAAFYIVPRFVLGGNGFIVPVTSYILPLSVLAEKAHRT